MNLISWSLLNHAGDFPSGPVVKNLPSNAGYVGSIPGWGTKSPPSTGKLSLGATARESQHATTLSLHTLGPALHKRSPCTATRESPLMQISFNEYIVIILSPTFGKNNFQSFADSGIYKTYAVVV